MFNSRVHRVYVQLGLIAIIGASFLGCQDTAPKYESNAVIKLHPQVYPSSLRHNNMLVLPTSDPEAIASNAIRVINSAEITERAAVKLGMPSGQESIKEIAGAYRVERQKDPSLITITGCNPDRMKAEDIVSAVIDAYRDYDLEQKSMQARKILEGISSSKVSLEENIRLLRSKKNLKTNTAVDLEKINNELRQQEGLYTTLTKQYEDAKLGISSMVSLVSVVSRPTRGELTHNKSIKLLLGLALGILIVVGAIGLILKGGKVQLKNLQSGVVIDARIGFSWTTFFFGFFPALFRGDIKWAAIMFIVNSITLGLGWLVFPFIYNKVFLKGLLSHGYVPVDESNKKILQGIGIVFA